MKKKLRTIGIIFVMFIFFIANIVLGAEKNILLLDLDQNQEINQEDYQMVFKHMVAKKTGKHQEWILENNRSLNSADCLAILRYVYASNNDIVLEKHKDWIDNLVHQLTLEIDTEFIKLDLNSNKEYKLEVMSKGCGELKYESSNTKVINVNQEGVIVAVGKGEAVVKVSDERNLISEECRVVVEANPISIELNKEIVYLDMTEKPKEELITTVVPNDKYTDSNVYWSSSDDRIATVDQKGNITAMANGNCIIYAKTSNNKVAQCSVKVNTSPHSISIEQDSINLDLSEKNTESLKAKILPETANINKSITWKSSDENIATVNSTGMVIAKNIGNCQIYAITENGKKCSINVSVQLSPEKVNVTPSSIYLDISNNKTTKLNATVTPSTSSTNKVITWRSSNENIAKVDKEGNVTGINNGECTIIAKTGNGKEGVCKVKVYTTPKEISISSSAILDMSNGNKIRLNAIILPKTANESIDITWSSSDESVAKVDENGIITGMKNGECQIKVVTKNGKEAICNLTVVGAERPSVTIQKNYQGRILTAGSIAEYRIIMNGNNISKIDTDKIKLKGTLAETTKIEVKQEKNEILVKCLLGQEIGTLGLEIDEEMLTDKAGKTSESTYIEDDYVFSLNDTTSVKEEKEEGTITVAVGVHNSFYIKKYDFYLNDMQKVRR